MPDEPYQSDDNPHRVHQSIFDRVKALFIRTGNITQTVVQGIPTEEFQRLAEELGVTKAALTSFFKILEQQHVPSEDLAVKLSEIATHYNTLLERVRMLSADDPHIAQLRDAVETAIHNGVYDRAEQLLNEASTQDLAAAQEFEALLTQRLLAAAEKKATNGTLKATQLDYAAAADYYRQAVELVERLPMESAEHLTSYLNKWGGASYDAGDYIGAERSFARALAIHEQVLGPTHPDVATSLNNLAVLYRAQGRYSEAQSLFQRALAIWEKVLGTDHPDVARSLNNLAALYHAQGRYSETEPLYKRALTIREKVLGTDHPDVALSLNNLALLYDDQRRYNEAEPLYKRALAIWEQVLGPEHPYVVVVLENYAALLQATDRNEEARKLKARAQTIRVSHR